MAEAAAAAATAAANSVRVWQDDPAAGDNPTGGVVEVVSAPDPKRSPLPTEILGAFQPPADVYPKGTPAFRYWVTASALRRTSDFWGAVAPSGLKWHPTVGPRLGVHLDAPQEDLNAYYDRQALCFFHSTIDGRVVFSAESPDVVSHEWGHAFTDALRPALWNAASLEAAAFHEAIGDIVAFISALQLRQVRERALLETGGALNRSSQLSRLAEQLGWGIRQSFPDAVEPDCLRNAVNRFVYRRPSSLPSSGPASILTSEPHSFSRVFSGAVFESLARVFALEQPRDQASLLKAAVKIAGWLVQAVIRAPIVTSYFAQVGAHLVAAATADSSAAGQAVRTAMVRHGILSATGVAAIATHLSAPPAAIAVAAVQPAADLPLRPIDVTALGLALPTIHVHTADQPKHFAVAGAAMSRGDVADASADDDAVEFIEQLIRRGRLDYGPARSIATAIGSTGTRHTHKLVAQPDNKTVLERIRVDCGCSVDHCTHQGTAS